MSTLKVHLRLYIIIIFEFRINEIMQNYLKKQVKKENERVKLDLSQIDFTE